MYVFVLLNKTTACFSQLYLHQIDFVLIIPPMAADYTIYATGDAAITIDFGNTIDIDLNKKVIHLYQTIQRANWLGIKDIVPAYSSLTIHYNVVAIRKYFPQHLAFAIMKKQLESLLPIATNTSKQTNRKLKIPVCYTQQYALDREAITSYTHLTFDDIIRIHTATTYRVYMIGFLPGFPYMGEVDARIAVPRKASPGLISRSR